MSLAEFQDAFAEALLSTALNEDQVEAIPYLPPSPILIKQFNVYRRQFLNGLNAILLSAYPTVKKIIGGPEFLSASSEYFLANPPQNVDPILICERFASFVETLNIIEQWPYLADIATIDLGCFQSKQAIDATAVNKSLFTDLTPEKLASRKVQLQPSCFWISSPFAIYDIWQSYHSIGDTFEFDYNIPQELIILRSEPNIRIYKANTGLVKTLDALDSGDALNTALEKGSKIYPELDPMTTIQFLIHNNLVTNLY